MRTIGIVVVGRSKACLVELKTVLPKPIHEEAETAMEEQRLENENQITIDRVEMGTGWVCFQGGENSPPPDQLPFFLNDALANWLRNNSEFKVRTILPIVVEGNTVAINVWFE